MHSGSYKYSYIPMDECSLQLDNNYVTILEKTDHSTEIQVTVSAEGH